MRAGRIMLMKVLESPKDTGGHEHDRLGYPAGPGQMGMAQARHFVPEGIGFPAVASSVGKCARFRPGGHRPSRTGRAGL